MENKFQFYNTEYGIDNISDEILCVQREKYQRNGHQDPKNGHQDTKKMVLNSKIWQKPYAMILATILQV